MSYDTDTYWWQDETPAFTWQPERLAENHCWVDLSGELRHHLERKES